MCLLHVSLFEDVHITITLVITGQRDLLQRMYTCMYMNIHIDGTYQNLHVHVY